VIDPRTRQCHPCGNNRSIAFAASVTPTALSGVRFSCGTIHPFYKLDPAFLFQHPQCDQSMIFLHRESAHGYWRHFPKVRPATFHR